MDHEDIRHKLSEYIDGSISAREKAGIEAHLKTCEQCSNALMELRKTVEHIKTVEEIEPPAWMTQKIMAKVRAGAEERKNWFQRFFLPLHIKLPIQVVAVVFLAVTAFSIYRSIQPAPTPSEAPIQEEFASGKEAAKDKLARSEDHALRAKQVPQAPEYKALDMKQEYEKPAPPKPMGKAEALTPAPAKTTEQPVLAKEETAAGKVAVAPQAGAPRMMREEAGSSSGIAAKGELKAFASAKAKSPSMADNALGCLDYEPTEVTISGVIEKVDFSGPPKYRSIAEGDRKETAWILKVEKPFCVQGKKADSPDVTETNISEVQLVLGSTSYDKYQALLNRPVIVKGTLFHSITIHHHTQVLVTVHDIELLVK